MSKLRLDQLLIQREIFETLKIAQSFIMTGKVLVNEQKIFKPGTAVQGGSAIRILGNKNRYVSRGGLKLEGALEHFGFDPQGLIVMDIGASTGGFTDCLLQKGAANVIALDVGFNQLDWKIRSNPKVTVVEKYNFRHINKTELLELIKPIEHLQAATIDVSFISLDKILPPLYNILDSQGIVVALVKPQFEARREQVGPGGIIIDDAVHHEVMQKAKQVAVETGYEYLADTVSPITGADGNKEYFIYLRKP